MGRLAQREPSLPRCLVILTGYVLSGGPGRHSDCTRPYCVFARAANSGKAELAAMPTKCAVGDRIIAIPALEYSATRICILARGALLKPYRATVMLCLLPLRV